MAVSVIVTAPANQRAWTIAIVDDTMQTNQADQLVGYIAQATPGANILWTASDQMSMDDAVRAQFSAITLSLSDDNSGNWADRVIPQMNRISYLFTEQMTLVDNVIALPSDIKRQFSDQMVLTDAIVKTAIPIRLTLSDSMNFWTDSVGGVFGAKISQVPVQVLAKPSPSERVSQVPVQVVAVNDPTGRVSQVVVQVLAQKPRQPKIWISS